MQSSSNGMLSALGLLACAVVAGMFAAKKWPQGPPRDLPLRAWDWLAQQAAPPHAVTQSEARYEGPPPKFNPASTAEGAAGPKCFAPPAVEFEEPPSAVEQPAEGRANPDAARTLPSTTAAPAPMRPASAISRPGESGQTNPSRYEPAKPSAFWPSDLADLLPGVGAADPRSPAS